MNTRYLDRIDQTYNFPQDEFALDGEYIRFHDSAKFIVESDATIAAPLIFAYLLDL